MDAYRSLVGEFGDEADFVMIYIEEAHPSDGWLTPNMTPHVIHSHRSFTERLRLLDATYEVPAHWRMALRTRRAGRTGRSMNACVF